MRGGGARTGDGLGGSGRRLGRVGSGGRRLTIEGDIGGGAKVRGALPSPCGGWGELPDEIPGGTFGPRNLYETTQVMTYDKPTDSAFGPAYSHKCPAKYCASGGSFVLPFLTILILVPK